MKQAKLNIEFVIEKTAPTTDQLDKWNKLFKHLFKKPKRAGESAQDKRQDDNKRIYKTCGFVWIATTTKKRITAQKRDCANKKKERQIFMKGSRVNGYIKLQTQDRITFLAGNEERRSFAKGKQIL